MADVIITSDRSSGIYRIRNIVNGKSYIGSAVNINQRWNEHKSQLNRGIHHSRHLQRAWKKYGSESFVFEVIDYCITEVLIIKEQKAIDELESSYNMCRVAGSTLGRGHSKETRKKISERITGTKHAPRSKEYREKIGAAHRGRPKSPEHMKAFQEGRKRQVFTDERRYKVSEALKKSYETGKRKREKTEEHKKKIGKFYAKLSDDEVREIKVLAKSGVTGVFLSKKFNTTRSTVSQILSGKRYRWVTDN